MNLKENQEHIKNLLQMEFTECEVKNEWRTETGGLGIYSPRLDVAVGPFAYQTQYPERYNSLALSHRDFLNDLINIHNDNFFRFTPDLHRRYEDAIERNRNARCFLAVEIENAVSRKHLMGGALNASAMGRIGLLVAWDDEKFRAMQRLLGYFHFLNFVKIPARYIKPSRNAQRPIKSLFKFWL